MLLPASAVGLIALAFFAGLVPGAAHAQAGASARGPAADTPLGRCTTANRQALSDLNVTLSAAQRRQVLNPLAVARLHGLQAQLDKLNRARDPRSLADCEAATQAIAVEAERLQRIGGADTELPTTALPASAAAVAAESASAAPMPGRVPACLATQVNAFNEIVHRFNGLTEPGRIRPERQPLLQALGARLAQMQRTLSAPAAQAVDCVSAGEVITAARSEIEQLAGER